MCCISVWYAHLLEPKAPAACRGLITASARPLKTPAQGAATTIYLASASDLEAVAGRYLANCKPRKSSKRSYDKAVAARLWEARAELVARASGLIGIVHEDGDLHPAGDVELGE